MGARPQLVVLSGPHKGDVIVVDDPLPVVFGRRAGVMLPDAALDLVHCQVFQAGGKWYLQDFGTPSGTWLGDERVEGVRPLELGRSFRIGETHVALLLPDQAPRATPAVSSDVAAVLRDSGVEAPPPAPPPPAPAEAPRRRKRKLDDKTDILPIETPSDDSDLGRATPPPPQRAGTLGGGGSGRAKRPGGLGDTVEMRAPWLDDNGGAEAAPPAGDSHEALGDYDLLRELGTGSLGKIYKAYDRRRRRVVAVKLLSDDLAQDPQAVGRFLRGAQVGARLSHPNIVAVHGAGHSGGKIYVTMEYVEGLDLESIVANNNGKGLPARQAVAILARVTDALVYAHARDVIHRSVTPRNILVGAGRTTKLVDLALAKRATLEKDLQITRSDHVLTTSPYAAPELLFDVQRVDHRADLYGVGASLFLAVTGHAPYEGTKLEVVQRLQKGQHGDIKKLAKGLSKPLVALVERCLQPDPARRFQAARELREAFAELPEAAVE